ncbi:MAG: DUF3267 domain-containing protein [Bryobacteraceae bacterium]
MTSAGGTAHRDSLVNAMAAPAIDELENAQRFQRIATFRHSNPAAFLQEYFHDYLLKPTIPIGVFLLLNAVAIGLIGVEWSRGGHGSKGLGDFGFGVILAFAFMPLHEALHGIAYKAFGANDVRYKIQWRRAMAFAAAHRFVAGGREFFWVAILPTLVINPLLLGYAYFAPPAWKLTILSALFVHIGFTSGDFALINFFYVHRQRQPATYDDMDAEASYFFVREPGDAVPTFGVSAKRT